MLTRKKFALLSLRVATPAMGYPAAIAVRGLGPRPYLRHPLLVLVGKLRAKLVDSALAPKYLAPESGVGLRLLGS